jgi:hypothetical protein
MKKNDQRKFFFNLEKQPEIVKDCNGKLEFAPETKT